MFADDASIYKILDARLPTERRLSFLSQSVNKLFQLISCFLFLSRFASGRAG